MTATPTPMARAAASRLRCHRCRGHARSYKNSAHVAGLQPRPAPINFGQLAPLFKGTGTFPPGRTVPLPDLP